jgi:DNA polymerase-3 subunit alpha
MEISKGIAGFSGPDADNLRKAIGKKNREAMAALKDRYFEGARKTGTNDRVIEELWSVNEAAADYSFNRSHAACYGLIGYRTAWLKANYPAEYMAALISSVMSTKDKVPFFVSRCEEMGIEVLPPDVNESGHDFKVVGGNIRFGLDAVKNVGAQAVEAILSTRREDGPFQSIWDFCRRADGRCVNKKAIEALAKCGAFDSLGASRTGTMEVLGQAQGAGQKHQQDALVGQESFFAEQSDQAHHDLPVPRLEDKREELNGWEKETLGLFLSSHPLKEVRHALRARVECSLAELANKKDGDWVTVGGMIAECKRIRTRKGDPMMFATLDDLEGQVEMLVFNSAYAKNEQEVDVDKIVVVRGRLDIKEQGEVKLVAQEVERFVPTAEELAAPPVEEVIRKLTLHVSPGVPDSFLEDLKEIVVHHPGQHELLLAVGERRLRLGPDFRVSADSACQAELGGLHGAARVVA